MLILNIVIFTSASTQLDAYCSYYILQSMLWAGICSFIVRYCSNVGPIQAVWIYSCIRCSLVPILKSLRPLVLRYYSVFLFLGGIGSTSCCNSTISRYFPWARSLVFRFLGLRWLFCFNNQRFLKIACSCSILVCVYILRIQGLDCLIWPQLIAFDSSGYFKKMTILTF